MKSVNCPVASRNPTVDIPNRAELSHWRQGDVEINKRQEKLRPGKKSQTLETPEPEKKTDGKFSALKFERWEKSLFKGEKYAREINYLRKVVLVNKRNNRRSPSEEKICVVFVILFGVVHWAQRKNSCHREKARRRKEILCCSQCLWMLKWKLESEEVRRENWRKV